MVIFFYKADPGISLSSTQAVLEELALGADGGFVDEPMEQNLPICDSNRLADDWSHFVDNPHLSDISVQTSCRVIRAHSLVFAARCPNLSKEATTSELNWKEFSSSAAEKVIRFVYTGRYDHGDGRDAEQVYRIAHRYSITDLIDLLPCHYGSSIIEEEEPVDQETEDLNENRIDEVIDVDKEEEVVEEQFQLPSVTMEQVANLTDSRIVEDNQQSCNSARVSSFYIERTARTPIDMEISTSVSRPAPEPQPLSPDMFAESDCEDDKSGSVIDLTQEDASRPPSPFAGSCEGSLVNTDEFDVSMADGSRVSSPTKSPNCAPINNSVISWNCNISPQKEEKISKQNVTLSPERTFKPISPVASTSKANYSDYGINQSISGWNDYNYGGMDHQFPSSPRSEPRQSPAHSPVASTKQSDPPAAADYEEFPDELNSIFQHDFSGHFAEPLHIFAAAAELSTPEAMPRPAKKRKIDVTPLPDYDTMNTPGLKVNTVNIEHFIRSSCANIYLVV